jgi:CBS domain-containing protein
MDVVMLPLVDARTTVSDALAIMTRQRRAGVVVQRNDDDYTILDAGTLLRARARGVTRVNRVAGAEKVQLLSPAVARKHRVDIVRPQRTWAQYEAMLEKADRRYSLVGASNDTAMVVTASEQLTAALSMAGGYECTGTPRHFFPKPRVNPGATCPDYPICKVHGGGVSKIRRATV